MENLKAGQKYTFVGYNDFGFVYCQQITLEKAEEKPYAQYEKVLFLTYRAKKQRIFRRKVILPCDRFIIWEGWVSPNVNIWGPTENGVSRSKFLSFSSEYLEEALASVEQKPVLAKVS